MKFKTFVKQTAAFTARNIKIFFRDKGTFISALIAPLVILLLYVLFLDGVLKGTFESNLPEALLETFDKKLINGFVASFEVASILATCGVTVAFVANMAMVDDKITGARADLDIAPVNRAVLVLGYYFATAVVTLIVCYTALCAGFIYMAASGWAMSVLDGFAVLLDVFMTVLFGTALSSVVCNFLKSRGAVSAVSTIVSTVYGFICGAYYPISQFASGIANTVMCLPGTYCTALLRTHMTGGFMDKFTAAGIPEETAKSILDSLDTNMYFFGTQVPVWAMYTVVAGAVLVLVGVFVAINLIKKKHKNKTASTAEKNSETI